MNHEFPINHAAAIARFGITNAHVLHFCITNAEEWGGGLVVATETPRVIVAVVLGYNPVKLVP